MTPVGFDLDGRVALVTGGAAGIGAGIAEALAEAGALVVIADRDAQGARAQAERLSAAGLRAAAVTIDLAEEAAIVRGCAEVVAEHGAPWVLVNNAGVQNRESLLDGTAAHWDATHAINVRAPFLLIREVARAMVAPGAGGRIVNIASGSVEGGIIRGLAAYAASKGALVTLGHAAAFELAEHAITVNTVLPGGVATPGARGATGPAPEGPARRPPPLGMCEPADIAAAVLYFASPAAQRVTDQVLSVDGGFSIT
ncbi:MAG: SDR family oxidoreductase [Novosphingobium sp.]